MSTPIIESMLNIPAESLPRHIAIIMDGNGRWAQRRNLPRLAGHKQGIENLRLVINACLEFGIKYLTIFAFSTENWGRPEDELKGLNQIFIDVFTNELDELNRRGVRILHIGQREGIGSELMSKIDVAVEKSQKNDRLTLSVALNYGSRNEILHAVKKIVADKISEDQVTEELITSYLFTADTPDPDLVIRTSGEQRLSNFLLWQSAYSEWVFPDVLWPDYDREELIKSIQEFAKRDRRFGKIKN